MTINFQIPNFVTTDGSLHQGSIDGLPDDCMVEFLLTVIAGGVSGTGAAGRAVWEKRILVQRGTGAPTILATIDLFNSIRNVQALFWDVQISVDATQNIIVSVKGAASTTINWLILNTGNAIPTI